MRRITLWLVGTVSALVVLFSYHTSTNSPGAQAAAFAPATPTPSPSSSATPTTPTTPTTPSAGSSSTARATSTPRAKSTASASHSYTGSSTDTQWGPVQVRITVKGGKITDAQAVVYPAGNGRDAQINSYALPLLHDEVLQAQSARIDAVGGATVTSDGYITSLQSAIDAAHLAN